MTMSRHPHGVSSFGIPVVPAADWGVGIGDVFWTVDAKATTNIFYNSLREKVDDDHIFTGLAEALAVCVDGQSDTIFMTPGVYVTTSEIDFTKSHVNVIGMAGPNNQGRSNTLSTGVTPSMPGVVIENATAGVVSTLHVTGHRNKFWGITVSQVGAAYASLTALHLGACGAASNNAYGNYFGRCGFQGIMDATYHNTIPHSSITIGSGSSYYMFEDCIIGQNTYGGARATAYQGHVNYEGVYATGGAQAAGYGPQNGIWRRCDFLSRGTTVTPVAIRVGGGTGAPTGDEAMDRVHWFIDCRFDNWYGAAATLMTSVFDDNSLSWHEVRLYNCARYGYDTWRTVRASQNAGNLGMYRINMGIAVAADGGNSEEPTT